METVLLNSDSKKVIIEKVSVPESKVEKNLGKLIKEGLKSSSVSRDEVMKALK